MRTATKVAGFTAEGVFVKLSVPEGMDAALQGLTREVLRHQPADIYWFAAQYFENLIRLRGGGHVEEIITHHEFQKSTSTMELTRSIKQSGCAASLAATTGTVAVLTAASASQPSAPPLEETTWVEEHTTSQNHTTLTKITSQSAASQVLSGNGSSSHEITSHSSEEASLHENNAGAMSQKDKNTKKLSRTIKGKGGKSAPVASGTDQFHATKGSTAKKEKYGGIANQVSSIVKEIAHDTVLKTEEISKTVFTLEDNLQSVEGDVKREEQLKSNHGKSKRDTRRLRRQTKSVDSSSENTESGDRKHFYSTPSEARINIRNEATVISASTEETNGNVSSFLTTESSTLHGLHGIRDEFHPYSDHKPSSATQDSQMNRERKSDSGPQEISIQNAITIESNHENGENTSDMKAEELRIQTEGSVRKSSKHDISEETCDDGTHRKVEEKAEETQEEKREASEKTVLERKSNVQVDENGDIVEEEITITRTEQSLTHETTVSKSWTMETTIETLADGETRVVERMIIHSPPSDSTNNLNQDANDQGASSHLGSEIQVINDLTNIVESNNIETDSTLESGVLPSNCAELNSTVKRSKPLEDTTSQPENNIAEEFGVVLVEDAKKSLDQISAALELANNSLGPPHASQDTDISKEQPTVENAEVSERSINKDSSVPLTVADHAIIPIKKETGLIKIEEVNKSLEQINHPLSEAKVSLELSKAHEVVVDKSADQRSEVVDNSNDMLIVESETIHPDFASTRQEANALEESGPTGGNKTSSSPAPDEVGTPSLVTHSPVPVTELSVPVHLSVAEDLSEVQSPAGKPGNYSENDVLSVSTIQKAEENVEQAEVSRVTSSSESGPNDRETVDDDVKPLSIITLNNASSLPEETLESLPETLQGKAETNSHVDETDTDKGFDSSKEGSKEDSSSELKGVSFHAHDYPTDEDQATPRDDVESLRIDTPEDNSSAKTSSGSDENGDPINPPTVVISRTADVIEVKDSEINIITQMEKEGLVSEGVRTTFDGPVEQIITRGALQTLADEVSDNNPASKLSPKIAGITVVAASTIGLIAAETSQSHTECVTLENQDDVDDTVEIVAADFDSNRFIQEEMKHSAWLLMSSVQGADRNTQNDAQEAGGGGSASTSLVAMIERPESSCQSTGIDKVNDNSEKIKSVGENLTTVSLKTDFEDHPTLTSAKPFPKDTLVEEDDGPVAEDDGKPIPVDENGKPMYKLRKRRSLQNETVITVANDIIPDESKIKLSRTGSLLGKEGDNNHWYGSQMSIAGSTLIKPALAMSRDPTLESLQPCEEPECVAVDVRTKDKSDSQIKVNDEQSKEATGGSIDVMKEMSVVTSRIGQSILSLGSQEAEQTMDLEELSKTKRSDSQESFIISEDAVYIPLNPSGTKQSTLERIDSVPSVSEKDKIVLDSKHATFHEPLDTKSESVVHAEVIPETEGVSPRTYTVTEPMSASQFNEQVIHGEVSDVNQDDDVLIVEYPTDPLAKVTKWDNVVVASPAEIKDEVFAKDELQRLESLPNEAQSYMSVDDSLQEVPSLQDEAVNIESESELLDSMPEEEAERKWTEDIAMAANKAKDVVKGIFSRGSSVQHEESADGGKHAIKSDGKHAQHKDTLSTSDMNLQENIYGNETKINKTIRNIDMATNPTEDPSTGSSSHNIPLKIFDTASKELSHITSYIKDTKDEVEDAVKRDSEDVVSCTTDALNTTKDMFSREAHEAENSVHKVLVDTEDSVQEALQDAKDSTVSAFESIDNETCRAVNDIHNVKLKSKKIVGEVTSGVSDFATETKTAVITAMTTGADFATNVVDTVKEKTLETVETVREVPKLGKEVVTGVASKAIESLEHLRSEIDTTVKHAITTTVQPTQERSIEAAEPKEEKEKAAEQQERKVETVIVQAEGSLPSEIENQHAAHEYLYTEIKTEVRDTLNSDMALTEVPTAAVVETISDIGPVQTSIKNDFKGGKDNVKGGTVEEMQTAPLSIRNGISTISEAPSHDTAAAVENVDVSVNKFDSFQRGIQLDTIHPASENTHFQCRDEPAGDMRVNADFAEIGQLRHSSPEISSDNRTVDAEHMIHDSEAPIGSTGQSATTGEAVKEVSDKRDSNNRLNLTTNEHVEHSEAEVKSKNDRLYQTLPEENRIIVSSESQADELLVLQVREQAENVIQSTTDKINREEIVLGESLAYGTSVSEMTTEAKMKEAEDETVAALELAEASVQQALDQAELTITSEAQKSLVLLEQTQMNGIQGHSGASNVEVQKSSKSDDKRPNEAAMEETVKALEIADKSVKDALGHAEDVISSEFRKASSFLTDGTTLLSKQADDENMSVEDVTRSADKNPTSPHMSDLDTIVSELALAEKSVHSAIDRAEETISEEARKSGHDGHELIKISESSTHESVKFEKQSKIPVAVPSIPDPKSASVVSDETKISIENRQDSILSNLQRSEESVQIALDRAENVISTKTSMHKQENIVEGKSEFSSLETVAKSEVDIEKTVSTVSLAHQLSEGIHDRVRREVSSLRDSNRASPRDKDVDSSSMRRGRSTSDITGRKAPSKSDSWESNLRRSTVASSGKIARHANNSNGSDPVRHKAPHTARTVKKAPLPVDAVHKTSASTGDMRRKGTLRKSKSLAEESPEDSKKRVKKMPSQGSTKKTAISVESAVEAAGDTVVEEVLHKVSSPRDQGDDTSSEASKSTTMTSSSSTQQQTHSSSVEFTESTRVVKSELVHAAATIQDAFREHRMSPVDENGKRIINSAPAPATSRTSFQIEPVLEEIAEEVGLDRQASSSRRGSRQDSHGADNEDTSTSESSLSSAATRIQAGFRGHLARRHRLVGGRHGTAGTASTSVSMSISRDSDVGVVRAMSLLEDSEVQRHQLDPLDQLPEADEYGPAKYVAEVHRVHQEARDAHKEWARSLDSGLSSGPERHTPVRSAVSMQQRPLRGRDLDEHIWRTLEQEMQEATDDSGQGEGAGGVRMLSRSSHQHRRSLHRGNAMQLPTTSSSTPGSMDEPHHDRERGREHRHTGEFHDMLVLHQAPPDQPPPQQQQQQQQQQPSAGTGRAGFTSSPQLSEAHPSEAPPPPQPPQQEVHAAELPDGATAAAPPPLGGDADADAPSSASLPSDMKTAEAAATKIQAGFRGYKVRRQLREQSQDQSLADAGDDSHVTGSAGSNGDQSQHLGQHAGQQCRNVGDMLESEPGHEGLDEELLQRSAAAARIQAGVRGFLVRRRQHNAAQAAAKIQAGFRGYRARRDLKQRVRLGKAHPTSNRQQQAAQ